MIFAGIVEAIYPSIPKSIRSRASLCLSTEAPAKKPAVEEAAAHRSLFRIFGPPLRLVDRVSPIFVTFGTHFMHRLLSKSGGYICGGRGDLKMVRRWDRRQHALRHTRLIVRGERAGTKGFIMCTFENSSSVFITERDRGGVSHF